MLKKHKRKIILSSAVTLLPILIGLLLWKELPDTVTTHWGADGTADGFSGKAFAVFGLPAVFLALHLFCLLLTLSDRRQSGQSPKALGMAFWLVPVTSLAINGAIYGVALGMEFDAPVLIGLLMGLLFLILGNYLPKVKQNRTLGIRLYWTLGNEENWYRTHRFAGKIWVCGGVILLLSSLLLLKVMLLVMACVLAAVILIPSLYSYRIYRQHQRNGIVYATTVDGKPSKLAARLAGLFCGVITVGVVILLFTGNIEVRCEADALQIEADYWADLRIPYAEIETAGYRESLEVGVRTYGVGSARLSAGRFRNAEFGEYTLYAYTAARSYIVLTSGDRTFVIGLRDVENARALYDLITEKAGL